MYYEVSNYEAVSTVATQPGCPGGVRETPVLIETQNVSLEYQQNLSVIGEGSAVYTIPCWMA